LGLNPEKGVISVTLDDTDRRLLEILQKDAGLSLEAIGEAVHLSRNACWRRIRALEASGVISGRVALLDPDKLGLSLSVFILVRTSEHSEHWQEQFRAATRDLPEILGVYRMTGELDYLIRARVANMAAYDRLYQSLIRRVALSDVSASFVMEDIKDTHCLPL
jgi:Lrp/AsnC family transcriptional regulator